MEVPVSDSDSSSDREVGIILSSDSDNVDFVVDDMSVSEVGAYDLNPIDGLRSEEGTVQVTFEIGNLGDDVDIVDILTIHRSEGDTEESLTVGFEQEALSIKDTQNGRTWRFTSGRWRKSSDQISDGRE